MNWAQIIERETLSIGRPIKVIDKRKLNVPGHDVRTIVYKPEPRRDPQMNNLYGHSVRVSTYINGTHAGSTGSKTEWSEHRELEDRF